MVSKNKQVRLKVIEAPSIDPVVTAPPTLKASDHTIEYICGRCDAPLLHAENDQVHSLTIQCKKCGRYNRTED